MEYLIIMVHIACLPLKLEEHICCVQSSWIDENMSGIQHASQQLGSMQETLK